MELLDKQTIESYLLHSELSLIANIEIFDQIDSTNDYLMHTLSTRKSGFHICLAENQIQGKGRRNEHTWISSQYGGIYLSVLYPCQLSNWLAAMVAVECAAALNKILDDNEKGSVGVKWPNDIYCSLGKLGGVLVESKGNVCVVGVGINYHFPRHIVVDAKYEIASLEDIMPDDISRNFLAALIIKSVMDAFSSIQKHSSSELVARYAEFDILQGKELQVITDYNPPVSGIATGLALDAGLLVEHGDEIAVYYCAQTSIDVSIDRLE